jgi:hypothetical protein
MTLARLSGNSIRPLSARERIGNFLDRIDTSEYRQLAEAFSVIARTAWEGKRVGREMKNDPDHRRRTSRFD